MSLPLESRSSVAPPAGATDRRRSFTDPDGIQWEVREAKNPVLDRRGGFSLMFESTNAVRRVRNYPPNWIDCSDAELVALSRGT